MLIVSSAQSQRSKTITTPALSRLISEAATALAHRLHPRGAVTHFAPPPVTGRTQTPSRCRVTRRSRRRHVTIEDLPQRDCFSQVYALHSNPIGFRFCLSTSKRAKVMKGDAKCSRQLQLMNFCIYLELNFGLTIMLSVVLSWGWKPPLCLLHNRHQIALNFFNFAHRRL
jgi:hypothetical protein